MNFDANPVLGPRENQLLFHNDSVNVGQGDERLAWIRVTIPEAANIGAHDFCIRDIACYKEVLEYETKPSTTNIDSPFDPTTHSLIYDSKVIYQCGLARAFQDESGNHFLLQNFTCDWDSQWKPSGTLLPCVCKKTRLFESLEIC